MRLVFFVVLLLIGTSEGAFAASFDCAKAHGPFEQAICTNPELSAADERLARTYETAIGGLSKPALSALRADQRTWLAYAQRACTPEGKALEGGAYSEQGIACLVEVFGRRSAVLETSRMMDGRRVYPLSRYGAAPDPEEAGNPDSYWPVAKHEMSYVQIDGTAPADARFNAFVLAEAERMSSLMDPDKASEIGAEDRSSDTVNSIVVKELAGGNRISLKQDGYWFGHGAAHGNYGVRYVHYLVDEDRALTASDLFAGKGWEKALLELTMAALKADLGDWLMLDDPQDLADVVTDPARWDLSDNYDLVIQFQPYEVAAYAYGAPVARISWAALEPYLAEGADAIRYGF